MFNQDPAASQHQHRVRTVVTTRRELTNLQREAVRTKKTKARKTEDEQAEDEEDEGRANGRRGREQVKNNREISEDVQYDGGQESARRNAGDRGSRADGKKTEEMNVEWRTEEKRVTDQESDTQL